MHYSDRKKTHSDKNVVIADVQSKRIGFLSGTHAGKMADKKIAEGESIAYPPGTVLYKDAGFQGYEPAVQETRQAKKNHPEANSPPLRSGRTVNSHAFESEWSMRSQG